MPIKDDLFGGIGVLTPVEITGGKPITKYDFDKMLSYGAYGSSRLIVTGGSTLTQENVEDSMRHATSNFRTPDQIIMSKSSYDAFRGSTISLDRLNYMHSGGTTIVEYYHIFDDEHKFLCNECDDPYAVGDSYTDVDSTDSYHYYMGSTFFMKKYCPQCMAILVHASSAPKTDWRPNEVIPEDYYA
jgi:hypothetical protein